jgi:hypothetical protein
VDDDGRARPAHHNDERAANAPNNIAGPSRAGAGSAQYDSTKKGQKTTGTIPNSQKKQSDDAANDPYPTFAGRRMEHSDTTSVPEEDNDWHTPLEKPRLEPGRNRLCSGDTFNDPVEDGVKY